MKLYSAQGVTFKQFTFPDGQRHVELPLGFEDYMVTIETRIASADDLFDVLLMKSALDSRGCCVSLNITYLLGARMDRPIGVGHPYTLQVVARALIGAGFRRIRVLDPHSAASVNLLRAEAILPHKAVQAVFKQYHPSDVVVVSPDAGARERVQALTKGKFFVAEGKKHRDMATGKLSGFTVDSPVPLAGQVCLILDDICDGGGTFTGLAKVLTDQGAAAVDLFVTHAICSKGLPIEGIRHFYATDSYRIVPNATATFQVDMPRDIV